MPFAAQITKVRDSNQTKVCTVSCLDNDPAGTVASYLFANAVGGMRPCYRAPTYADITRITGPASESEFQIEAMSATGFTIRKLTAGVAGQPVSLSIEFH